MNLLLSKQGVAGLLVGAAVASAAFLGTDYLNNTPSGEGRVVAKVNGSPIYESEIKETVSQLFPGQQPAEVETYPPQALEALVKEIAIRRLIVEEARKQNIDERDEVRLELKRQKEELLGKTYVRELANDVASEEELQAEYQKLSDELKGKDEYKISHVLVKTEAEAEKVRNALVKNDKLAAVAKKYSLDRATAERGGSLGFVLLDKLDPDFKKAAEAAKLKKYSQPVKTQFGWHILRVDDKRPASLPPYEQIKAIMEQQKKEEKVKTHITQLLENANIDIIIKSEVPKLESEAAETEKSNEEAQGQD